jgi:3-oxoacyl-[acyl-carrier protein] reductase
MRGTCSCRGCTPDGIKWAAQPTGTTEDLRGITYGNGRFIAVGQHGRIIHSDDGRRWTPHSTGTKDVLIAIAHGAGQFVALGWRDKGGRRTNTMISTDGLRWSVRSLAAGDPLFGVAYGSGMFVGVGDKGAIVTSPDGGRRTSRRHGPVESLCGVHYGDVTRLVAAAARQYGRIDTVVCNAGGPPPGGFQAVSDEQWLQAVNLTLLSAARLVRAALPHLKESGAGRVVALASSSVKQPLNGLVLSNTLRAGVHAMIKSCADEFAAEGILLNTVGPGRIATDRMAQVDRSWAQSAGISVEEQTERTQATIPLGRYGAPEEFARYVLFLGSPANTYVTGQSLMVDGGLTRAY